MIKTMALHLLFYAITFFISLLLLLHTIFSFKNKSKRCRLPPSPMSLPIIGHMHLIKTVPYRSFHKLSTLYGPLIHLRLGSVPCIIASSPELAKEFLMTHELTFASRPATIAMDYLTYNSAGFVFTSHGPLWKFMKKVLMSELLGGQALTQRQYIRRDEILRLVQLLAKKSNDGEMVNVSEELMKLSTNIISRMMLGLKYSGRKDQVEEARTLVREVTQIFGQFNLSDCFGFLRNLDLQGVLKKSIDFRQRYDVLLERIMEEREEDRKKKKEKKRSDNGDDADHVKDFLDILLDASEDENSEIKLSRDNIKAFLLDILTAGTDTLAAATEWALGELIKHPHILEKAREEIDSVVGKNRLVDESDLPDLPYLQAIFKEALRLHPPVPMLLRESSQACKVRGYDIPAKTWLFVNVWSINRNPKYWKTPLEFRPERFMTSKTSTPRKGEGEGEGDQCDQDWNKSSQNKDVRGQHFDLLPFGTGRRGCPGIWLSLLEVPAVLAAIIQCFDWKVAGNGNNTAIDMTERPGLTVPKANPILLIFAIRLGPFTIVE